MWSKVSFLRKKHDGRDWTSNHWSSDLKSKVLPTTPVCPCRLQLEGLNYCLNDLGLKGGEPLTRYKQHSPDPVFDNDSATTEKAKSSSDAPQPSLHLLVTGISWTGDARIICEELGSIRYHETETHYHLACACAKQGRATFEGGWYKMQVKFHRQLH